MSYDLLASRVPPGMTLETYLDIDVPEDAAPPSPDERAAMERLAAAIAAVDAAAERVDSGEAIEYTLGALQVSLYAREAVINFPYWFDGEEADAVLRQALAYARVLEQAGGYTVWDPQTGNAVDEGRAREAYARGRETAKRTRGGG